MSEVAGDGDDNSTETAAADGPARHAGWGGQTAGRS